MSYEPEGAGERVTETVELSEVSGWGLWCDTVLLDPNPRQ